MLATMADAHREWHRNAGVPMGTPGCPQDACHLPDEEEPVAYVDGVGYYDMVDAYAAARHVAAITGRACSV